MTRLCVALTSRTPDRLAADMAAAKADGATAVEIRLDHLDDPAAELPPRPEGLQLIVTLRPSWEGGRFEGGETDRRRILLDQFRRTRADWVDVEYRALQMHLPFEGWDAIRPRAILSFHDFGKTPADIALTARRMHETSAAKIKLAAAADDIRDSLRVLRLFTSDRPAGRAPGDLIALAMGEAGLMTRILAGKFGAFLTFASLSDAAKSAPGQITAREMLGLYRFDRIGPATEVYGVIGWPVSHSMSPAIHNTGFAALGLDKVYVHLPIRPGFEALSSALDGLRELKELTFRGASVTIPHKEDALRWARERGVAVDAASAKIGATNTLKFGGDLPARTLNTDVGAISKLLRPTITCRPDPVYGMVLGAGGAARSAIVALQDLVYREMNVSKAVRGLPQGHVVITNRTLSKSLKLAEEFQEHSIWWEHREAKAQQRPPDYLVNCTSLGMSPNVDDTPFPAHTLNPKTVVFDTIYNPPETRLLREAKAAGCRTISGVEMFVEQAVAQFELWTGESAPREVMERVVRERLGAK